MIRLLIADDSALMRKLLEGIFTAEGDFDIRMARDGNEALELVRTFDPQVVTLDVQMPGMDGLTCLSRIMIEAPRPVVMISSLTADGAEATLEAIELGAVDFIAKPGGAVSLEIDRLRPLLVEKVRAASSARIRRTLRLTERVRHQMSGAGLASRPRPSRALPPSNAKTTKAAIKRGSAMPPGLVLVGTSTGGPAALDTVLPQLPADFPWPVLVAQHLPASFTGPFAKRLDRECRLDVVEVNKPMPLRPGTIYIGKGDADVMVAPRASGVIVMPVPAKASYLWHPSVERMVASALDHLEPSRLVGVMMTGMGNDGAEAMKRLRLTGGHTIAEAESSAIVWGMPGELVKNGGAEKVRPLEDIAETIIEMVNSCAAD